MMEAIVNKYCDLCDNNISDEMWHRGMASHLATKDERIEYIKSLTQEINKFDCRTYINNLAYLLHTFFYSMDEEEKKIYVKAFLIAKCNNSFAYGEILELIGILFKGATDDIKCEIFVYIKTNAYNCLDDASAIVALCNCFRCVNDDVTKSEQKELIAILEHIKDENKFGFVNETIELTVQVMEDMAL